MIILLALSKANEFLNTFIKSFAANYKINSAMLGSHYSDSMDIILDFTPNSVHEYLKLVYPASAAGPIGLPGNFWHTLCASLTFSLSIKFSKALNSSKLPAT